MIVVHLIIYLIVSNSRSYLRPFCAGHSRACRKRRPRIWCNCCSAPRTPCGAVARASQLPAVLLDINYLLGRLDSRNTRALRDPSMARPWRVVRAQRPRCDDGGRLLQQSEAIWAGEHCRRRR